MTSGLRRFLLFLLLPLIPACTDDSSDTVVPVVSSEASEQTGFRKLTPGEKAQVRATTGAQLVTVEKEAAPQVTAAQSLNADESQVDVLVEIAQQPAGDTSSYEAANALAGLLKLDAGISRLEALFSELPEKRREWVVALIGHSGDERHLSLLALGEADESAFVRARSSRARKALSDRGMEGGAE